MGNGLCVETSSSWTVFDWLDKVLGSIGSYAGVTKSRSDDNFADRLSHHYTPVILIIFTILVSTQQYTGRQIDCWCPAQFTDAQVEYIKMVCWVSNTYHIPMSEEIPKNLEERETQRISYYQWVPMILLAMALMFKIPRIFWKAVSSSIGLSIDKATNMLYRLELAPAAAGETFDRENAMNDLVDYLDKWLRWRIHYNDNSYVRGTRTIAKYSCFCSSRRYGNYFMTASVVTKIIYFAHALFQFFLLNVFVGSDFVSWGFLSITGQIEEDEEYQRNTVFPRVTLCDFALRQHQNVQTHTVQCVLAINLFNKRIFFFIWIWLVMLIIASFYTLVTNVYALFFPWNRVKYIKKYLKLIYLVDMGCGSDSNATEEDRISEEALINEKVGLLERKPSILKTREDVKQELKDKKKILEKFVKNYLKFDGFFVLRVMGRSGNEILTAELMNRLWERFQDRYMKSLDAIEKKKNSIFACNGVYIPVLVFIFGLIVGCLLTITVMYLKKTKYQTVKNL